MIVKFAAVHNIAAIASGIARSGADIIAIDGFRGGTGAAPTRIRDNVGIPIELALASVDQRLREEGIRHHVSLVVGGSIRNSADVVKAIALGADAVYIATSELLALGCHLCRSCHCLLYTSVHTALGGSAQTRRHLLVRGIPITSYIGHMHKL